MANNSERNEALLSRPSLELLLKRVAEVQALFVLVERITPFVRDLVDFVYDVGPMLLRASRSLRDSSAKMPKASQHLDDVTHATEMATTQVLDRVDQILTNLEQLRCSLEQSRQARQAVSRARRLLQILGGDPEVPAEAREEVRRVEQELAKAAAALKGWRRSEKLIENTQECSYEIMSALQVQDITAQQLAAARELIIRVYDRIRDLLQQLGESSDFQEEGAPERKAYDASARFDFALSAMRQENVDRLLVTLLNDTRKENAAVTDS